MITKLLAIVIFDSLLLLSPTVIKAQQINSKSSLNNTSIEQLVQDLRVRPNRQKVQKEIESVGAAALPVLIDAMHDSSIDGDTAGNIHMLIGKIGKEEKVNLLTKCLLEDRNYKNRQGAAIGLGYINEPSAKKALKEALNDQEGSVKMCAVRSLAKLGDNTMAEYAIDALSTNKFSDHELAIQALEFLRAQTKIDRLTQNLTHTDPLVRTHSKLAILRLNLQIADNERRNFLLEEHLNADEYEVCRWVAEYMAKEGSEQSLKRLKEIAEDPSKKGRHAAAKVLHIYESEKANENKP